MEKYLSSTKMLDFKTESIQKLVNSRGWKSKDPFHLIKIKIKLKD